NPALGAQDQPHLVRAVESWDARHRWETGAGGAVWDGIAYDASLNLVYIGTGNASPYDIKEDGRTGGDDLYTRCMRTAANSRGISKWSRATCGISTAPRR